MRLFCRLLLDDLPKRRLLRLRAADFAQKRSCGVLGRPVMSQREEMIRQLSYEVFSKGNVHLKNVNLLSALPEGLHSFPEVCFIGKPNVGKSSIISCLLRNPRLGRFGRTRGTTRLLQFFNVGDAMLLVDTPGYGGWRGRQLPQKLAERADAFAVLFRYLALRRQGPLKRVYWVMEAAKPIQHRDEELFAFLQKEKIPFSVILNKIDRFHGDNAAFQQQVHEIWNFLGSDQVPVLGVRANPKFPEKCINITSLQHDITYYCTHEITRIENLTYKSLKELSYMPPSLEEVSAVERRYPVESFIVPQEDNLSLERFVQAHEKAKLGWMATSSKATLLSAKDKFSNHLLSCRDNTDDDGSDVDGVFSSAPVCLGEKLGGVIKHSTATPQAAYISSSQQAKMPARFCVRASLRAAPPSHPMEDFCLGEGGTTTPCVCDASVSPGMASDSSSIFLPNAKSELSVPAPLVPQLPPSLDDEAHAVPAINGVRIPMSMVTSSVAQLPASKKDSLEHFAQHSGAGDYNRLLEEEVMGGHIFLEEGNDAGLVEGETSLRRPLRKSARRRCLNRIMEKYVSRVRKKRSLYMQAEGYMCPWLAGAGQPLRVAVMGLAPDCSSIGKGGSLMMGLKRTGFGGQSYSANTMKHRGRATKKTGFWAT